MEMYIFADVAAWQLTIAKWVQEGTNASFHMERKRPKQSSKCLKGLRNYQTNFMRTKQCVLSSLANKSPVLPLPWAVLCYSRNTSPHQGNTAMALSRT